MNAQAPVAEKTAHPLIIFKQQLDAREGEFKAALPAHIPAERFARVVMTAVQNNPDLQKCSRRSFFNACIKAAQDGLEFAINFLHGEGIDNLFYLSSPFLIVPIAIYWTRKKGKTITPQEEKKLDLV